MATIKFNAGDEYLGKISRLATSVKDEVCGPAIYSAASIVADAIRDELQKVPADETHGTEEEKAKGPRKIQKKGLYDSLGITKLRTDENGDMDVKIGFDGYNGLKTKTWPKGQPNQMIARSVERGTSFMDSTPFIKKAVSRTKAQALDEMKKTVDKQIESIMERK